MNDAKKIIHSMDLLAKSQQTIIQSTTATIMNDLSLCSSAIKIIIVIQLYLNKDIEQSIMYRRPVLPKKLSVPMF